MTIERLPQAEPRKQSDETAALPHVWLRTNVRALAMGLAIALPMMAAGGSAVLVAPQVVGGGWLIWPGWGAIAVSSYVTIMLLYQMRLPRLAYEEGHLLVYLESARPQRVPIEIVELFFPGVGESLAPASDARRARTVIIRLAERATEWHDLPIRTAFGQWREAYVILNGAWCEPLAPDVFKRLNQQLAAAHRQQRERAQEPQA